MATTSDTGIFSTGDIVIAPSATGTASFSDSLNAFAYDDVTLAALRRRGYTPEAIRAVTEESSATKVEGYVDLGKIENAVRDHLNKVARGRWFAGMAVGVITFAVVGALFAVRSGGGVSGIVATMAAMPLFVVAFQAGRLAGRVEAVQRVRALFRS